GEISGTIEAVAPGSSLKPGQRVMATSNTGGYAEFALAYETDIFPIPDSMPFEHAAAFPIVYQTSYFGLVHRGQLKSGEWLLVHAAAGGVGSAAVQIGKALGAKVIATASSEEKLRVCRDMGADHAISYKEPSWVDKVKEITGGKGADVIYDPVGGDTFDLSTKCIAFEGRLVVIGFASGRIPEIAANRILLKNIAIVGLHFGEYRKHNPALVRKSMDELLKLYSQGKLRPVVSKTYPMKDAPKAMRDIGSGGSYGKLVLVP
ncbi:MAG: NADPH:quinone oxidoreductase family protein, partial [Bdellovibrionota bacterium]